ncbi:hypothetical protein BDN72DRAFT_826806 [Pluteus cervinus]|uniref:Uncharacterized protein n=1 Tax=Pluteus cervinus TaxID=181527 RepID=A0ACD3AD33_9AGAR|nr:hypothetical protein BDN72DRAFT_826806 [Pluteus cervinus]
MAAAQTQESEVYFSLQRVLQINTPISSLAFGHASHLFVGSGDGSLRVYDLSTFKVVKAIKGLGSEVSSIVCVKRPSSELRDAWVGCGKQILKFQLDMPKMILEPSDALLTIEVGDNDQDEVNELAINVTKSHLAFSLDSGHVGVVDLKDNSIRRMNQPHTSVSGSVKFIPDWPKEIVSGGYDTALHHYNFTEGDLVARHEMPRSSSTGGTELAPPFVMCTAVGSTGVVAAGTADGHLWLGYGGDKDQNDVSSKKKKSKKPSFWGGLHEEHHVELKIAEGPVVAMAFVSPWKITTSTMLGVVTQYLLDYDSSLGKLKISELWEQKTHSIEKVNALVVDDKRIIIGGFDNNGRGMIELWQKGEQPPAAINSS